MEPQIFSQSIEVDNALIAMGVSRDQLIEVVRFAESERALCTDNDPIGFASMTVFARGARMLRQIYLPKGWEKDDTNNQAAIRNPKTMVRIVPCNFDDGAGNRLVTPSNKSPKGEVSRKKSICNRTAYLPFGIEESDRFDADGFSTWLLGMHIDDVRPTRAELSLPIDFDGSYFTRFGKRIILLDGSEPVATRTPDSDDVFEEIDIAITRR